MRCVRSGIVVAVLVTIGSVGRASAHPLAPALLEITESQGGDLSILWKESLLAVPGAALRPVLPPDCATTGAPIAEDAVESTVTRWRARCAQTLVGREVGVDGLVAGKNDALVRVTLVDGRVVKSVLRANASRLTIPARQRPLDVLRAYSGLGLEHILTGPDHLLFVFGLLLLVGAGRLLVRTITAFTVGHSITLSLAVLGIAAVPPRPVEV